MKVVTLCGSTRFKAQFEEANDYLTKQGYAVFSVGFFEKSEGKQVTDEEAQLFGELHFKKIDMSDEIFVIDANSYIGESTKREIEYATVHNKKIRYYSDELGSTSKVDSNPTLQQLLLVMKLGEKLKMEMRHSSLSNGRQESVAEHTWRVALMAILLEPYFSQKVQMEKLLKMITIHDIIEAIAGDVPAFDTLTSQHTVESKRQKELAAILEIRESLPTKIGDHLFTLWHEFEDRLTFEAKVANALDKLEAQLQHNEAGIDTWLEIEFEMTYLLGKHVNFDETLTNLKDIIVKEAEDQMNDAGYEVDNFKLKAQVRS
mgnify:CR=1 FL=1